MMIQSIGVHKVTAHRASQHQTPHTEWSSILIIYSDETYDILCVSSGPGQIFQQVL